ncbi:UDP-forming cellulose synthase catalytic subunit, partial [Acidiphilium sp.]|uniref:UDP-forming cellulose synthase catalytic subunit n=1 Tax=Acidiphilium sp. TaxID=527 RepID=UPI003D086211
VTATVPYRYGEIDVLLGFMLIAAEAHGAIAMAVGQLANIKPTDRRPPRLPDDPSALPRVDIFIPTYNEDPEIVTTTMIAATQMRYPADRFRVFILDDGGTDAKCAQLGEAGTAARARAALLQHQAATYGATYMTRSENSHAKAGNLNAALARTDGELVLVLDCDHVPTEDFLRRTVGFFLEDPKLFLLQTPHNFVTSDPIERNLRTHRIMPAENELFYAVTQPGLDSWGAAFFCGSAAVLRRSALDDIGGISGRTITEDAETTIKALSRGWKTAFYNRPMVSGLQPETFTGFVIQRTRWAQGMIQIFILENVWLKPGLTFMQRLLFTNSAFFWLFPIPRMIMLAMPPAFLLFNMRIVDTTPTEILVYAVPYYIATIINSQYFFGRVRWPLFSQVYETAQSVFLTIGVWSAIRHPTRPTFKVTPKGEILGSDFISALIKPFYVLAIVNFLALVVGTWRLLTEPRLIATLLFVGLWACFDALILVTVIGALSERRQTRLHPRAERREPIRIRINGGVWYRAKTHDLSRYGASIFVPPDLGDVAVGDSVEVDFVIRKQHLMARVRDIKSSAGHTRISLRYAFEGPESQRLAVRLAFGDSATLAGHVARRRTGLGLIKAAGFLVSVAASNFFRHIGVAWRYGQEAQ